MRMKLKMLKYIRHFVYGTGKVVLEIKCYNHYLIIFCLYVLEASKEAVNIMFLFLYIIHYKLGSKYASCP